MTGAPAGMARLVGRDAELQRGERLIEDAVGDHGTRLWTRGIGKTAVAAAIGRRAAAFAGGRCYEGEGTPVFEAWHDRRASPSPGHSVTM